MRYAARVAINCPDAPPPLQTTTGAAATAERLNKMTDTMIRQVESDVAAGKADVVEMLVRYVTHVR